MKEAVSERKGVLQEGWANIRKVLISSGVPVHFTTWVLPLPTVHWYLHTGAVSSIQSNQLPGGYSCGTAVYSGRHSRSSRGHCQYLQVYSLFSSSFDDYNVTFQSTVMHTSEEIETNRDRWTDRQTDIFKVHIYGKSNITSIHKNGSSGYTQI